MEEDEFPSNSKNVLGGKTPGKPSETPEKKIEKVVTSDAVRKPKTIGSRFRNIFLGGNIKNVLRFLAADVIMPGLRDMVADTLIEGTKRTVYGASRRAQNRNPEFRSRVSYESFSSSPITRVTQQNPRNQNTMLPKQPPYSVRDSRYQVEPFLVSSREDATLVVEQLFEIISVYGVVSVADLYDLVGLSSLSTHVDNKWGWAVLQNVDIRQTREGYVIDLPLPEAIN